MVDQRIFIAFLFDMGSTPSKIVKIITPSENTEMSIRKIVEAVGFGNFSVSGTVRLYGDTAAFLGNGRKRNTWGLPNDDVLFQHHLALCHNSKFIKSLNPIESL